VTAFPREVPPNVLASGLGFVPGPGPVCIGAKLTSDLALFAADCPYVFSQNTMRALALGLNGHASFSELPIVNGRDYVELRYAWLYPWGENSPVVWSSRRPFPDEPVTVLRVENEQMRVAHSSLPEKLFAEGCGCAHATSAEARALVFGTDAHLIALCSIDACNALNHCISLENARNDWDAVSGFEAIRDLLFSDLDDDSRADAVAISRAQITARRASGTLFGDNPQYFAGRIEGANAVALGDVTGDRRADLITIGNGISVYPEKDAHFADLPIAVSYDLTPARMARVAHVVPQGKGELILLQTSNLVVVRDVVADSPSVERWYKNLPAGITNFDVRDVTGDGLDDALLGFADHVAILRSTGSAFGAPETWLSGMALTAPGWFFADLTGDHLADAIRVDIFGSQVYPSNGSGFEAAAVPWREIPIGERGNYFADVTGDGAADAIVQNQNNILVLRSNKSGFGNPERWLSVSFCGGGW
jgi:hypothetical protein